MSNQYRKPLAKCYRSLHAHNVYIGTIDDSNGIGRQITEQNAPVISFKHATLPFLE